MSALQLELSITCSYYVEKLSEFMASTGRQYQSHAATIRRWAAEDKHETALQDAFTAERFHAF